MVSNPMRCASTSPSASRIEVCCALALVLAACRAAPPTGAASVGTDMQEADLILRDGDVWTNDRAQPHARAVAMAGGRITAIGDDDAVGKQAGPHTRVVDLGGRSVLCALTDAHAHLYGLGLALDQVDLRGCGSPPGSAARVRPIP